ncbi:MAG: amidase family protein, partial [Gemmobacter sp.]
MDDSGYTGQTMRRRQMIESLAFTLSELHRAYASGLRPADVMAEFARRVAAADDPGIFLHLIDTERLRAEAEALGDYDSTLPLWGIPFAVKDNIDVAGCPTTAACPAFAYMAERDAFVVAQLRAAGALPVGKTNLDQFATGLVGVRTPWPVPRNALDPLIVPGGSSSGSAVAVARGLVAFSLGTDTAGSGRVPAALNNIVGLKPSLGALSTSGVVPACRTLDAVSVFALTVADAHAVFRAACAFDAADAYARPIAAPPVAQLPDTLRIGIPSAATIRFFGDTAQQAAF